LHLLIPCTICSRVGNSPVFYIQNCLNRIKFMVKFMVTFRKPQNSPVFENAYNDFLALVERMPYITRRQVVTVLGSPVGEAPYYRILETYYESLEKLEES